jgi:hypothetical protein
VSVSSSVASPTDGTESSSPSAQTP